MKGLIKFLGETWWLFGSVAIATVAMAYTSGIWFFLVYLPVLAFVAVYMSAVRYDRDGNLREDNHDSRREP